MKHTNSYAGLGLKPVINAHATLTRLGGSVMPQEVLDAMVAASRNFVDLEDLQRAVGVRIAELTGNEGAYVSSGAAAGLTLATAACAAGGDPTSRQKIPHNLEDRNEVIIQRLHRNGYDYAVRQVGVRIVEIGDEDGTKAEHLSDAITEHTAAIFWFQGGMNRDSELPLPEVISIAQRASVPVIVDAAAQLPPVENLWKFTEMGASLAIFSGGKDLAGPQSSGLVLGKSHLIEAIRLHGNPNQGVGRPMKVGKEELMGCLAAVERYIALDHDARDRMFEETVAMWVDGLAAIDGVQAVRDFPNEAGQPVPWCLISFTDRDRRNGVVDAMLGGDPRIDVAPAGEDGIHLNPMTLMDGEAEIVLQRLLEVLGD